MRKLALAALFTSTAFMAVGAVQASIIAVPIQGSGSLTLSGDIINGLETLGGTVAANPPLVTIPEAPPSHYIPLSFDTAAVDAGSKQLLTLSGDTTGVNLTSLAVKNVSTGGALTITDLSIDLAGKRVFATLIGANGVGTLNNVYLWNFTSSTGDTALTGAGTYSGTFNGLSVTQNGFATIVQALGLQTLGKSAFNGIQSYGDISWTATVAVPEPGTWAMSLLGLGAIGAAVQRRRQQA